MTNGSIGILGGIFDPLHNGHLAIASLARDFLRLEQVVFIPSGNPPHKSTVTASADHRLEMLRRALINETWAAVWDREVLRPGFSYTIDTLHELREVYPDPRFYFIVGSDNLAEIPSWRRYREILSLVTLCVAHRPCHSGDLPSELSGAAVARIPSPEWGISSTMIRSYLRKGYRCRHLLPDTVLDYITTERLYGVGGPLDGTCDRQKEQG